ncbi:right-handed parallel beta-helix repeat-containing protein [Halosimplex sp. TS25]|uniref:right-handed parallel beta-helix repeat-containing protein n=1 Tax=Halosimplex rarum TaxID=3396619 RepID=UPI0039EB555A
MTQTDGTADERGETGRTCGRDGGPFSRRAVLKTGAAAAGGLIFGSGVASADTGTGVIPTRLREKFDRVVDVVEAGADDTGSESIVGVLERLRDDDRLQHGTLLYFPPGRYYIDRQFRMTGFDLFGMYGNDATLVPADYHGIEDDKHKLFRLGVSYNPGNRLFVENFAVDQTADDTGARVLDVAVADRLEVRDIDVQGKHDSGAWGPGRFVVTDPDGTGVVERFTAVDGGEYSANAPHDKLWRGPSGIICNTYNEGRMTFRECELGGFPDNGLYAAGTNGQIRVWRGTYRNSNGANVRVGGPNSEIIGVDVVVDRNWEETEAQRGIRVEKTNDVDVKDCYVRIAADTPNSHAISVQWDVEKAYLKGNTVVVDSPVFNHGICLASRTGDVTVYQTSVEHNGPGGSAFYIDGEGTDDEWAMLAQVTVTGSAGHKWNRAGIYNKRNNVEFRAVDVDQTGSSKRRALENFGDDCMVYACDFTARQHPLIDTAADTRVEDSTFYSADDRQGIRLTDTTERVYLKNNEIENDVKDEGCSDLKMAGNTFF